MYQCSTWNITLHKIRKEYSVEYSFFIMTRNSQRSNNFHTKSAGHTCLDKVNGRRKEEAKEDEEEERDEEEEGIG